MADAAAALSETGKLAAVTDASATAAEEDKAEESVTDAFRAEALTVAVKEPESIEENAELRLPVSPEDTSVLSGRLAVTILEEEMLDTIFAMHA